MPKAVWGRDSGCCSPCLLLSMTSYNPPWGWAGPVLLSQLIDYDNGKGTSSLWLDYITKTLLANRVLETLIMSSIRKMQPCWRSLYVKELWKRLRTLGCPQPTARMELGFQYSHRKWTLQRTWMSLETVFPSWASGWWCGLVRSQAETQSRLLDMESLRY